MMNSISYIASHTKHIGESASDILRRMLKFSAASQPAAGVQPRKMRTWRLRSETR
jgi:negative modulator of initiation of replication